MHHCWLFGTCWGLPGRVGPYSIAQAPLRRFIGNSAPPGWQHRGLQIMTHGMTEQDPGRPTYSNSKANVHMCTHMYTLYTLPETSAPAWLLFLAWLHVRSHLQGNTPAGVQASSSLFASHPGGLVAKGPSSNTLFSNHQCTHSPSSLSEGPNKESTKKLIFSHWLRK